MKSHYNGEALLKKWGLGQFANLRGGLARKMGWCFRGLVDTPMHTISYPKILIVLIQPSVIASKQCVRG